MNASDDTPYPCRTAFWRRIRQVCLLWGGLTGLMLPALAGTEPQALAAMSERICDVVAPVGAALNPRPIRNRTATPRVMAVPRAKLPAVRSALAAGTAGTTASLATQPAARRVAPPAAPSDVAPDDGVVESGWFSSVMGAVSQGGRPARVGDRLRMGVNIEVGDSSMAEIRFIDGSSMVMRANSELAVAPARRAESQQVMDAEISLRHGRVETVVHAATPGGLRPYVRVLTTQVVLVVKGTEFRVDQEPRGAARLEVVSGAVALARRMEGCQIPAVVTADQALVVRGPIGTEPVAQTLPAAPQVTTTLTQPWDQDLITAPPVAGAESYLGLIRLPGGQTVREIRAREARWPLAGVPPGEPADLVLRGVTADGIEGHSARVTVLLQPLTLTWAQPSLQLASEASSVTLTWTFSGATTPTWWVQASRHEDMASGVREWKATVRELTLARQDLDDGIWFLRVVGQGQRASGSTYEVASPIVPLLVHPRMASGPAIPGGVRASWMGDRLLLRWDAAADAMTHEVDGHRIDAASGPVPVLRLRIGGAQQMELVGMSRAQPFRVQVRAVDRNGRRSAPAVLDLPAESGGLTP